MSVTITFAPSFGEQSERLRADYAEPLERDAAAA